MPFSRPQLSDLQSQVLQDIAAGIPGADPLLRFSNLGVLGNVQAALAYLHYGYLDWISQQAQPFTATGEFLEAWAALKGVYRIAATPASGTVTFTGTNGLTIPSGTPVVRGDGQQYLTTAGGTVSGGSVTVPATAAADPAGLAGAVGNTDAGSIMSLGQAIPGINSSGTVTTAFTGGADLELDTSLRARMLLVYQSPSHGGDLADYQNWALQVPGVTRVWVIPHGFGAGTVIVYTMFDSAEAAHGGFPQGANGCATGETRAVAATGDQLAVANLIFPLQPVTALVYSVAPTANVINFTISGIAGSTSATQASIASAIANVFRVQGAATGSTVALSAIEGAIAAIPGTAGFVIVAPASNIVSAVGELPVLGTVSYV